MQPPPRHVIDLVGKQHHVEIAVRCLPLPQFEAHPKRPETGARTKGETERPMAADIPVVALTEHKERRAGLRQPAASVADDDRDEQRADWPWNGGHRDGESEHGVQAPMGPHEAPRGTRPNRDG